jgi:hypothetical protein
VALFHLQATLTAYLKAENFCQLTPLRPPAPQLVPYAQVVELQQQETSTLVTTWW